VDTAYRNKHHKHGALAPSVNWENPHSRCHVSAVQVPGSSRHPLMATPPGRCSFAINSFNFYWIVETISRST